MKEPSEKTIVTAIMTWLKSQPDVYAWKTVGTVFGRGGIPDICGTVGLMTLFLEAKRPKGVVSPRQKFEHDRIKKSGGMVWIVRSLDDAKAAVEALRTLGRGIKEF